MSSLAVHNRLNAAQKDEWPSSWRRDETFAGVVQARGAKKMHWIVQFKGVSGNVIAGTYLVQYLVDTPLA